MKNISSRHEERLPKKIQWTPNYTDVQNLQEAMYPFQPGKLRAI